MKSINIVCYMQTRADSQCLSFRHLKECTDIRLGEQLEEVLSSLQREGSSGLVMLPKTLSPGWWKMLASEFYWNSFSHFDWL